MSNNRRKVNENELKGLLSQNKKLKDLDLSSIDFSKGMNFKGRSISNVSFSECVHLKELNFEGSILDYVSFDNINKIEECTFKRAEIVDCTFIKSILEHCSFEGAHLSSSFERIEEDNENITLKKTSFEKSTISRGRFRSIRNKPSIENKSEDITHLTSLYNVDFRYCQFINNTFEDSYMVKCDFYRSIFKEINVFLGSKFTLCSFNHTYFDKFSILKENIEYRRRSSVDRFHPIESQNSNLDRKLLHEMRNSYVGRLYPEDKNEFERLLRRDLINDNDITAQIPISEKLKKRHEEAARIYRNLSANWDSNGYYRDSEWAYLKAKEMEIKDAWEKLGLFEKYEKQTDNYESTKCKWYYWPYIILKR